MNRPYFTIAIPSLNRLSSLNLVVESIVRQTFKNYEILIVDDCSDEDIPGYIASLRNEKIRFIRNRKRLGFKSVFKKALLESQGIYVMTLGNDDFLCSTQTLQHVYKKLENSHRVGLAKLPMIYYYKNISSPCLSTKREQRDVLIASKSYEKIFKAIDDYGITHIAGTIYLRDLIKKDSFSNSDMLSFFKTIVYCATSKGMLFIPEEYVAVGISTSFLSLFSKKKHRRDAWYHITYNIYKHYIGETNARRHVRKALIAQIPQFVAIRANIGIRNMIFMVKEYLQFDESFRYDPVLYFHLILSILIPTGLFLIMREIKYSFLTRVFKPPESYIRFMNVMKTIS